MIVNNVCLIITTGTREVVNAGLSFIKVIIASFFNDLMPQLPNIVCIIQYPVILNHAHFFRKFNF